MHDAGIAQVNHQSGALHACYAVPRGLRAFILYQSTLVSDDAPFDRYAEGKADALSAAQTAARRR